MKNFLLDDNGRNHIKFHFLKEELNTITDPEEFYSDIVNFSEILFSRSHVRKGFKLSVGKLDNLFWLMQVMRNNEGAYVVVFYFNDENLDDFLAEAKMLDKMYSTERILMRNGKRANQTSTS